mmetsp:Transcript_26428/g.49381  ORF Transcript_26428/g.49381 Transcript_26428/m.49381 type:complete len:136 (+) Transcript_26428:560-967(+)
MGAPIHIHFRVHHTTTATLAWAMWQYRTMSGAVFSIANVIMHIFLYAYFGGMRHKAMFWFVRIWGHVQLILGTAICTASILVKAHHLPKGSPVAADNSIVVGEGIPLALCLTYFVLFRMEITDSEAAIQKKSKKS